MLRRLAAMKNPSQNPSPLPDDLELTLLDANPEHAQQIVDYVRTYRRIEKGAPTTIGPYRVLGVLGEGGMGIVYHAADDKIGRQVALKCMKAGWSVDVGLKRRFEREVAAIARLDHPAICKLFDYGEVEGLPYFAMQLVDGVPLDRVIAAVRADREVAHEAAQCLVQRGGKGRPDIDAILTFTQALAEALDTAHARGFVHRDIKPANIMVDVRGAPVILDFGLVRDEGAALEGLTLSDMTMGTPAYMAPEQIDRRRGEVGPRTDIHALGLVLFELLSLQVAFQAPSLHELQKKILRGDRVRLRKLCGWLAADIEAIVDCATATDPARRYTSAAAMAEDLRRLRAHEPILARRAGWSHRLRRWTERNPVAATVGVALVAGLLLAGRLLWVTNDAAASTRRHLDRFFSLAVAETLRTAELEAEELHPASPENEPKLAAWLEQYAVPLTAEVGRARDVLAQLDAQNGAGGGEDAVAARFLARTLRELLPRLQAFLEDEGGVVADVRRRRAWAANVRAASVDAHRAAWEAAIAAVRASDGVRADRAYAGLGLTPQVGLVPLGMDPESRLWEFYDLASAAPGAPVPQREGDGRVRMKPESGVVFVLVPGGRFTMGAQREGEKNVDQDAETDEVPLADVELAPFLLSKFELTQGQWQRLTQGWMSATRPAFYGPTRNAELPDALPRLTDTNPVENVAWQVCARAARRFGFELPTEAQWEYACRAGGTARYSWGEADTDCPRFANVADGTAQQFAEGFPEYHAWQDGHVTHAAVGMFAPNAFGLHDMHGNVLEFCADWKVSYAVPPAPGTGLRLPTGDARAETRVARGGCYQFGLRNARSADRHEFPPGYPSNLAGLRPARAVHAPGDGR